MDPALGRAFGDCQVLPDFFVSKPLEVAQYNRSPVIGLHELKRLMDLSRRFGP